MGLFGCQFTPAGYCASPRSVTEAPDERLFGWGIPVREYLTRNTAVILPPWISPGIYPPIIRLLNTRRDNLESDTYILRILLGSGIAISCGHAILYEILILF